jgi:hypothetical protein
MAAIAAVKSLTTAVFSGVEPHNVAKLPASASLPYLLALYDALNDDDDEVRAEAALATSPILGHSLVSIEAGSRLLKWLGERYTRDFEFQRHIASRMLGLFATDQSQPLKECVSAKHQLYDAMQFDDALFVIEEQNLYFDEIRETRRWRDVWVATRRATTSNPSDGLNSDGVDDQTELLLARWSLAGLETLLELIGREVDDGPIGWTSKPAVFAICAKILISSHALVNGDGMKRGATDDMSRQALRQIKLDIADALEKFDAVGRESRIHGLLLEMGRNG